MEEPLTLVAVEGQMPYASNTTLLATDRDGGRWIYKPEKGESPLWDFTAGTLAAREVLTYEVSSAMGLDLVPETVLADGPHGPGSAQRFVDEDFDFDPRPLFTPALDPRLWPVAVLDLVCNNADRKVGHLLRERETERFWAIDHGLTFHVLPKLRTVLWGFAGQVIPSPLLEALERLRYRLGEGLSVTAAALLSAEETRALSRRVDRLLARPLHPAPPLDRPAVPWPVW